MKPLKRTLLTMALVVICLLSMAAGTAAGSENGEQLRRTMADISLLNSQLAQRKADAAQVREELASRLNEIKIEIRELARETGVKDLAAAMQSPRIRFDLQLMAEIQAYMDQYARKIRYYRVACDRLSYLYQQADDDLKIVKTLSGMKIDALVSQTEMILNAYFPDAQTLVIHPMDMVVASPETVWVALYDGQGLK